MLKNYFKIAIRNLLKHKSYAFINIAGLAIGMACCILILLYVQDELSYDRYHEKADRIYRATLHGRIAGNDVHVTSTSAPMAAAMVAEYPEVEAATRLYRGSRRFFARYEDLQFTETELIFTDSSFFDVFTLPLVEGNPKTALNAPNTVVITEEIAAKYFADENPIDQTLTINFGNGDRQYTVSGVCEKLPANSHFHFDFLASLLSLPWANNNRWISNSYLTYFVLQENSPPEALEAKFPALIRKYVEPQLLEAMGINFDDFLAGGGQYEFRIQRLTDIHLNSHLGDELEPNGDATYVTIFLLIAFFILLLACINFMNLATARSANRAKEVGVRKAVGSSRGQLVRQFLSESFILSGIALVIALILVQIFMPAFNQLAAKQIRTDYFTNAFLLPGLLTITAIVGMLAGVYPAFFLASFRPVEVLKGKFKAGMKNAWFRSSLVVFQFAISIMLIIGTFVVRDQLQFIKNRNLGFEKEHVLVIYRANALGNSLPAFESELKKLHQIVSTSAARHLPGTNHDANVYRAEGAPNKDGYIIRDMQVGYDFVETLGMEVVAGRSFSHEFSTDSSAYIINEAAVRKFEWTDPIGKTMSQPDPSDPIVGTVIGVVKDFHFESLHHEIVPAVLWISPHPRLLVVRFKPGNIENTLAEVEQLWRALLPDQPFEYTFLDEDFDMLYRAEQRVGKIFSAFTFLGIFIACLGLFGLASFAIEQRTKEIGIRKVLGASLPNIVILLSKEFTRLVIIAFIIAAPVAYYTMNSWLQGFAYRAGVHIELFVLSGIIALSIAWLTVSFQSFKAAFANPTRALQHE